MKEKLTVVKVGGKVVEDDASLLLLLSDFAAIEGKKFDKKIAFGDTEGDKPMLNFANESHFQFFQ